jgi:hypothetical protein
VIHELRQYTCTAGSLPLVLQRFETATLALFRKHGIRPIGFWTTLVGDSHQMLHYILEWDSLSDREARWSAFVADPEWQAAFSESEKKGPLIATIKNQILRPALVSAGL